MTDFMSRADRRNVRENRSRPFEGMELREAANGTLRFTGYASVTETPYEMQDWLGDYTEVVRRGAFSKTLAEGADVPFKLNHDGMTLARTKSGTMRLSEDSTGLHVEADLDPGNGQVRDIRSAMERGDLDEMSFAFRVTRQEWSPDYSQRDITEVNLNKGDVSIVNYGANPHTAGMTSLRSALTDGTLDRERLAELIRSVPELADMLADRAPAPEAKHSEDLSLYEARLRRLSL
ncbi:HK97 family phage prohead protease [Streptomyces sp. WI03-4A]|uniref:HK97 family phage prohead protease n=1 Tax=Streptomyces sp. WI03-4A TaxID=3028706 RepID=UPI0029BBD434|nr:HK97 family phage prohead protease [Streptomyces sp. WI03-4A]MDX2590991.1 HK97 family phage prohead protease [Streptomyces sp. WI03-4A]